MWFYRMCHRPNGNGKGLYISSLWPFWRETTSLLYGPEFLGICLRMPAIHEAQNTQIFYILFDNSMNTPPFKNLRDNHLHLWHTCIWNHILDWLWLCVPGILNSKTCISKLQSIPPNYSLFQKKRTFNSPPGGGEPKIRMMDYVIGSSIYIIDHVNFWPPSPRRATKKIEIKCAFLLE